MEFALLEEHRMLKDLVRNFVTDELLPLEPRVLDRERCGEGAHLAGSERARIDARSAELGLWGLDAPEEMGGMDLPQVAMVGVNEEIGRTVTPYVLPPDSPNLRMLMASASTAQKAQYLEPYARGETISAIGISEPGAGADPAGMKTRAVKDGTDWVINGRKIWVSKAADADFTIVMAVTDKEKAARGGITAFIVDAGTPGYEVATKIPMIGGHMTYELVFEDCRVPEEKILGEIGKGFAPMQLRLSSRRLEMAAWCIGASSRALEMICDHASERVSFGATLAERQTIQNWVADAATRIHACRLMTYDAAWKVDEGQEARTEVSMVKAFATEMAWQIIDRAMQAFGAMGMTKEFPLQLMASNIRNMRIYEGPTEIHNWVVARELLGLRR